MGEWNYGLFGCFSNMGLCIVALFSPWYVHGMTAQTVGDNFCLCCLTWCCTIPFTQCYIRGKVREDKGIDGSKTEDFLYSLFCFPLVLCQSAQEMNVHALVAHRAGESMGQSMARE